MDGTVIFLIGFVLFLIVGFKVSTKLAENDKMERTNKYQDYKLLGYASYVGGIDNLLEKMYVTLYEKNNSLFIELDEKHNKKMINIPYKNLIKVEGKNEEQISNEPTVLRLLVFGVLALGLKKQKVTNRKFFILTYNNKELNEEKKVIFEHNSAEKAEEFVNVFNKIIKASN